MRKLPLGYIGYAEGSWPLCQTLWIVVQAVPETDGEIHPSDIHLHNLATVHDDVMLQSIADDPVQHEITIESLRHQHNL